VHQIPDNHFVHHEISRQSPCRQRQLSAKRHELLYRFVILSEAKELLSSEPSAGFSASSAV
jgi:hypothetical protein